MLVVKEDTFVTPLGIVKCGILANEANITANEITNLEHGQLQTVNLNSYKIELITFKIKLPLYNGESVKDSKGWLWRIEKILPQFDPIQLYCRLVDYDKDVEFGSDPGEHLDAIEIRNDIWVLHIGVEDGEMMHFRGANIDGMPFRLKDKFDFNNSLHEIKHDGFQTAFPDLNVGEKVHLHYLAAFDKKDKNSVNTWLAVDMFKRDIENWVGIGNPTHPGG